MSLQFSASIELGRFGYEAAFGADREIVVLFGHSGAGKSVTLQMIAGLLRPAAGRINVEGRTVFDTSAGVNLPPQQRGVGYVVQDLALFPHMTVADNVAFGATGGPGRPERVAALLQKLGLEGFERRKPGSLSGGQQQRVALARALAREARVLLLDEPFSALDEELRSALRRELLRLRSELGLTIVFVTHDLREAHLLADRIAVFDGGRILQLDGREAVFRRPASSRVAGLTGVRNVFRGHLLGRDDGGCTVEVEGVVLRCGTAPAVPTGGPVDVCIRAERVNLRRPQPDPTPGANQFAARVVEEFAYGSSHTLHLQPLAGGPAVESELAARPYEVLGVAARKDWTVELPPADLHVMPVVEPAAPAPPPRTAGR